MTFWRALFLSFFNLHVVVLSFAYGQIACGTWFWHLQCMAYDWFKVTVNQEGFPFLSTDQHVRTGSTDRFVKLTGLQVVNRCSDQVADWNAYLQSCGWVLDFIQEYSIFLFCKWWRSAGTSPKVFASSCCKQSCSLFHSCRARTKFQIHGGCVEMWCK